MSETTQVGSSTGTIENTGVEVTSSEAMFFNELDTPKPKKAKEEKEEPKKKTGEINAPPEALKKTESKTEKEPEKKSEKKAETTEKAEEKPPVKMRKYKHQDQDAEIPEDAIFYHKVNGEEVPVSIQDLLNNYSGKTAWDKKFSELDRNSKAYEAKVRKVEDKILSVMNEKDPELRMARMAELAGQDPIAFRKKFLEENMNLLEKYYAMSEDERNADALQYENRILKRSYEDQQKSIQEQAALQDLDSRVGKMLATKEISKEAFLTRYDELIDGVEKGIFTQEQITPEFIAETIEKDSLWESAANALSPLGVQVPADKMLKLVEMAFTMGMSKQDVAEMAKEAWGTGPAKESVKAKQEDREEVLRGKKPDPLNLKQAAKEAMFFDDLY